ncbi:MAG TPA: SelT/SelW/SelH family protein [Candidatus Fraserbacteria bacterium]|nr:SelT/SelW/SelH family protein [Candidatus Fraserbacteria bacterium]
MAQVQIEYCVECLYLARALETAQALLESYADQLSSLELLPGSRGVFTVTLDDRVLYRMKEGEWRLPSPELLKRQVGEALSSVV